MDTNKDLEKFRNKRDMTQSASLLYASAVILQMALGQVSAVNALTGKKVFEGEVAKDLVPSFNVVFDYLHKAYQAYDEFSKSFPVESSKG